MSRRNERKNVVCNWRQESKLASYYVNLLVVVL